MNILLVDGPSRIDLLPLTFTRPVSALRCGILTLAEKYTTRGMTIGFGTEDYLSKKFTSIAHPDFSVLGSVCPTSVFLVALSELKKDEYLAQDEHVLAVRGSELSITGKTRVEFTDVLNIITKPWHIWTYNAAELESDYDLLTQGRASAPIHSSNTILGDRIFLEKGAKVTASILNTTSGSIYLAKDAEIMEGCMVRGGLALGEHSALKLGTKIYGATTLGPHCKVGGEVNNSVFLGYSNKGHDGFLGNSALGEWCNLGADTNNSNLKNNYDHVKAWSYQTKRFTQTGEQFCGLIMGDHSKSGINTMFNTGTVVGVSANIYGAGFPRNFISSFSWGGPQGTVEYKLDKALDTAQRMMQRRGLEVDDTERNILEHVYETTKEFRR